MSQQIEEKAQTQEIQKAQKDVQETKQGIQEIDTRLEIINLQDEEAENQKRQRQLLYLPKKVCGYKDEIPPELWEKHWITSWTQRL